MLKIDVITLHYVKNYGSVLQTYATQKILERLGNSVEFIDYIRPNEVGKSSIEIQLPKEKKGLKTKIIETIFYLFSREKTDKENIVFGQFVKKYISLSRRYLDEKDLLENPPEADVYCTGSDQMWNSEWNGGLILPYYLNFAPKGKKKISFSTSIGMNQYPENEIEETQKYMKQYDLILVREDSAVEVLKSIGCEATQIVDPTLMLSAEEWRTLAAPRVIKYKYVLVYQLNRNKEFDAFARKLAKDKNIKVVRVAFSMKEAFYGDKYIYFPTVEEWLSLFLYAEYVVTDSFHGTAFSINLHKKLYVFEPPKFAVRIHSILRLVNLENRVVSDSKQGNDEEIDFDKIDKILELERKKAIELLEEALIK